MRLEAGKQHLPNDDLPKVAAMICVSTRQHTKIRIAMKRGKPEAKTALPRGAISLQLLNVAVQRSLGFVSALPLHTQQTLHREKSQKVGDTGNKDINSQTFEWQWCQ